MSTEVLNVAERTGRGTAHAKKLRRSGHIPAVLYGHGEGTITLSLKSTELGAALRHNVLLVQLQGAANETALLTDVQWDALGSTVLHVDLTRVRADEVVDVEVAIVLRGDAPGTKQGGVVEHAVHSVMIECRANAIPEHLEVNINELVLGQELTLADLDIPAGVKVQLPEDTTIVSCVEPVEMPEEEAVADMGAEPEVIGGDKGEEGDED